MGYYYCWDMNVTAIKVCILILLRISPATNELRAIDQVTYTDTKIPLFQSQILTRIAQRRVGRGLGWEREERCRDVHESKESSSSRIESKRA